MGYEEYKRKALEPIVSYIESVMASYSKEELEARIKKALPEKESEDERIIMELKDFVRLNCGPGQDEYKRVEEWCYWLEKQKEQKPAEWSNIDELKLQTIEAVIAQQKGSAAFGGFLPEELIDFLKSLRPQPKQDWSEEDENKIESIKGLITTGKFVDTNTIRTIWKLLDSLRPQPHWKPSKEQMEALNAINCHGALSYVGQQEHLISLYKDIKKL